MVPFLFLIAYLAYAAFLGRIIIHVLIWYKATKRFTAPGLQAPEQRCDLYAAAAIDLCFFRRLFLSNKLLWIGSWTFHLSFLFVILGHLRYFLNPVPRCITFIQPVGVVAGYLLPASLLYLLGLRIAGKERYVFRYVSYYNFFLLGLLFLISITGLLMRRLFVPDLMGVKEFILGLFTFRRALLPQDLLFIFHFLLVLLLAAYLPTHFFAAPLVTIEARKREEELKIILHKK